MKEKDEAASSTGDQHSLHLRSSSPSLTPAASSVGASSPAVPANGGGADFGQVQDSKGGSLARIGSQPISASLSTNSAGSYALGTSKPSCRPWERGDLLRRLSTFGPTNWFGKPKAASSLACARRGWVNVDVDKIECESCGATMKFVLSAGLATSEADAAEEEFAEKLDHEHKDNCPWIGNLCAESLVQFPPASPSALIAGYRDRCDVLLQFPSLPIVAASSIEHMRISRGPEIDRLLQSQIIGSESRNKLAADKFRDDDVFFLYPRAQKLISVCGWEPRWLPNVQDCEEHSAQSAKNVGALKHHGPPRDPNRGKKSLSSSTKKDYYNAQVTKSRTMSRSPLLDCSLCGATVRIWNFLTVSRPSSFVPINTDIPEASKKMAEEYDEGATGEGKSISNLGVDLNLTLSAGFSSSQMHGNVITEQYDDAHRRELGRNLPVGQPSSSEVGDRAASYESHGPSSRKRNLDEGGGSTVDRPQLVLQHVDSDDSGHYSAGPSKRARDSYRVEFDQGPEQVRDSTRVSSVVAVDTVHSANSDSMESVENYPADLDDINMPSTSEIKNTELHEASDLNYSTPAQQSNCPSTARSAGVSSANEEELVNADNATAQSRDGPSFGISGGIVGMGDSHKSEIHGADASMNRAGVTGEVELITELSDNLGQTGEFAPDPVLMGDFVPEEIDREHGQGDSQDLALHSVARQDSGSKIVDSKKEESVESGERTSNIPATSCENSPHPSLSCNAVVYSGFEPSKGEVNQSPKYLTTNDYGYIESGFQGTSGTGPPNGVSNYDEVVEFDPIKHHHVTCPWVNGNVAAAADARVSSLRTALCGWQLTLEALDAYQTLGQVPVLTVESESAASLYKDDQSNRPPHSFNKSHSNN